MMFVLVLVAGMFCGSLAASTGTLYHRQHAAAAEQYQPGVQQYGSRALALPLLLPAAAPAPQLPAPPVFLASAAGAGHPLLVSRYALALPQPPLAYQQSLYHQPQFYKQSHYPVQYLEQPSFGPQVEERPHSRQQEVFYFGSNKQH